MSEPTQLENLQALSDALTDTATPYGDLTTVDRDNRISISSDVPLSQQRDEYTDGVTVSDGFKRATRLLPGSAAQGNAVAPLAEIDGVDLTLKGGRPVTVFVRLVEGTGGTVEAGNTLWTETW
jgi:hypothetical protein